MGETSGSLALQEKKVIVIEAARRPETRKLRVAAYCRVSSDSSDQMNSFTAQLRNYTALIGGRDTWAMADLYADAGISGTSAARRPEFQRLLTDCRRGAVDKVLVKSVSRFARNTKECLETVRELKSIGVSVRFEEQNIDTADMSGELLTAVFAAIAQKESESISGNMRWSYRHRMQSGQFITCKAPFGYRLKNGTLEICEPEAEIVRMIFSQYLAGKNQDEIAAEIAKRGVPTRDRNGSWQRASVAYILRNEKYVGDALLQKQYTTDTLPYRQKRNRGECAQYFRSGSHPAIIDRKTFEDTAALLRRRAEKVTIEETEKSPLSRKMVCGRCGAVLKKKRCGGKTYWVCASHFRSKDNCPATQIPEEELHAAFLRVYHRLRLHGEPILNQLVTDLQAVRERRMLWSLDIIELNKRISDITDQERMLADMNKLGLVDPDIFISQSNLLSQQLQTARREKECVLTSEKDDTIPRTQELLETLSTLPEFLPDFDGEIFTELVEQITADDSNTIRFRLKNGLELTETVERGVR